MIEANSTIIRVLPYEINITASNLSTSTNQRWLYDANNIDDSYINPNAKVSIFNKSGQLMRDFNSTCYGRDLNITFKYDINSSDDANLTLDGNLTSNSNSIDDINKSVILYKSEFRDGEANASYRFGIDRDFSRPINPIDITLKDIIIDTQNISKYRYSAKDSNSLPSEDNAVFYYGRVVMGDMIVNSPNATQKALFEVYSNNPNSDDVSSFARESLNWYLNSKHNSSKFGTIKIDNSRVYKSIKIDNNPLEVDFTAINFDNRGRANLDMEIAKDIAGVAHMDIDRWLWYIPSEFGSTYNFSLDSSCNEHPCFDIRRDKIDSKGSIIQSGNYRGLDYNGSNQGEYNIRGVKLFR